MLLKWDLEIWIGIFKEEEIDTQKLFCLEQHDIERLITKTGPRAKFIRHLNKLKSQIRCDLDKSFGVRSKEPPTVLSHIGWNRADHQNLLGHVSPFADFCDEEAVILNDTNRIMTNFAAKLRNDSDFGYFLRNEINNIKTEKKEIVGIFGQTGTGKSSLINAVIGEMDLLPTGSLADCTAVMINVEATQHNQYEAEIEFITVMEWEDELWSAKNLCGHSQRFEDDDEDEDNDLMEKLSTFYGDTWNTRSVENLMDVDNFQEVSEFLCSVNKKMFFKTAAELMEKIAQFTRSDLDEGNRCYWPLVKCVTVRVPNNNLLKHVTLVDLPGKGNRNKSRGQMWEKIIEMCSAVWIVTDRNRALADRDAWDILKSACALVEKHGTCCKIDYICTKCDVTSDDSWPSAKICQHILEQNKLAKKMVMEDQTLAELKVNLLTADFQVFTVSSREFRKPRYLEQHQTEIPKLREVLHLLNILHPHTFTYLNEALDILSLMKEAQSNTLVEQLSKLRAEIKEVLKEELSKLKSPSSSFLTGRIKEDFRKLFPNDGKSGPFYGVIHGFSLVRWSLMKKYNGFELQLRFLRTQEDKLKIRLIKIIRSRKKEIYKSISHTMADTLPKEALLKELKRLMEHVEDILSKNLEKSVDLSLSVDVKSIPDVSTEFEEILKHHNDPWSP